MNRGRVNGFLDVRGRQIVNGAGELVLLNGWALGNWLNSEGYMWLCDVPRFDRPRRMEVVIEELTGKAYAEKFWRRFRENYVTEDDIQMMAELGYNSVRVPINARLFIAEGPKPQFIDEGFELLDRLIGWCEQYGLYVFIDLHAAPGGQTGSNIDDSVDDICRLFSDQSQFERGIALWERIAERYADRWVVGGYELLNRPIRPVRHDGDVDLDIYVPRLVEFYERCIDAIRAHDERHIVILDGYHMGERLDIFDRVFDSRMVLGFHRYGCVPDITSFRDYLAVSERLDVPLWLATGENTLEWYSSVMPLAINLGIGFNVWTWKKMGGDNSPCRVLPPAEWRLVTDYVAGGPHPGYDKAVGILNAFLDSVLLKNCNINEAINANIFLTPGCVIAGANFDEFPGDGVSYGHGGHSYPAIDYRRDTGMNIFRRFPERCLRVKFDGEWAQYVLRLGEGDFACYTLYEVSMHSGLEINCFCPEASVLEVWQDETALGRFELSGTRYRQVIADLQLDNAEKSVIRLKAVSGTVDVESLVTRAGD